MISETDVTSYVVTFIRTWNTLLMSLEFFRSIFRPTLSVLFWYSWFLNILVFGKAWFSLRYLNYESYFFLKYNTSTVRSMKIWCIRGQKYGFDSRSCVRGLNSGAKSKIFVKVLFNRELKRGRDAVLRAAGCSATTFGLFFPLKWLYK